MNQGPSLRSAATLLRQGDLEEAENAILHALEGGADPAAANELLGAVYLEQQRPELAACAAAAAVRLDPGRPVAYRHLARAHQLLGRRQEALQTLLTALDHSPDDIACYVDAVQLLRDLGAIDQALALLDVAASRLPAERWQIEHLRLGVLAWDRRYGAVRETAEAVLVGHQSDVPALDHLSSALYQLGDLPGAVEAARRLVAAAPQIDAFRLRLATLLREAGRTVRAVAILQNLADTSNDLDTLTAAREALALLDATQLPVVLLLAGESAEFLGRLHQDPPTALVQRGFALSRDGLASLLAMLGELSPDRRRGLAFH